jgi:hypothetical protein
MMPSPHSPKQNHLLAALPTAEFECLAPHLELVPLPPGEILYEPGEQLQYGYFPTTAIVSLHHVMASGGPLAVRCAARSVCFTGAWSAAANAQGRVMVSTPQCRIFHLARHVGHERAVDSVFLRQQCEGKGTGADGGEYDTLIPSSRVEMTARHYGVEAELFHGMGHGLMLECGWERVASRILDWLESEIYPDSL